MYQSTITLTGLGWSEALELGNDDGAMANEKTPSKLTTRPYRSEEKAAAVRMAWEPRAELGTEYGTVRRVAAQLGYGIESVRIWFCQVDIQDRHVAVVSTNEAAKMKSLEQENRELKRVNESARAILFAGSDTSIRYLLG